MFLDARYLPETEINNLRSILLRSRIDREVVSIFLDSCSQSAQEVNEYRERIGTGAKETRRQLEQLTSRAGSLLQCLASIKLPAISTFNAHFDYLAFGTSPPVEVAPESKVLRDQSGGFLRHTWNFVSDLEIASEYAANQCKPSRDAKTTQMLAKMLIYFVAGHYKAITGKPAPYSKDTWFPEFMQALGQSSKLKLVCGRALVESVIRKRFHPPG